MNFRGLVSLFAFKIFVKISLHGEKAENQRECGK